MIPTTLRKGWFDMLADSLIIACIALFSTSGELSSYLFWIVGLKAFCFAFVVQLGIERGLKKEAPSPPNTDSKEGIKTDAVQK